MIIFNVFRNRTIAAAVSLLSALTLASCWENFSDGFMGVRESAPPAITLADSTMTVDSVTLNWTEPDAVSYSGTRITCDGNGSTTEITVARGTTTYTITGLTGVEYTITTRAVYSTGHESSGTSFKITPAEKSVRFTYTAEHLNDVRNGGLGDHCVLMADIDLSGFAGGTGWIPIESFVGVLDGNGHAVSNLTINDSAGDNKGLFGSTSGATIQNLALKDVSVSGNTNIGAIAGNSTGGTKISNCTVEGTVSGNSTYVGGLVGNQSGGSITDCSFTGAVSGNSMYVGGLAGYSTAAISGSSATGTVSGVNRYVGGLVGHCPGGSITNSHSSVDVSGNSISAGGLVGHNENASITNCHATGSVTGSSSVGGLVGFGGTGTTITISYATGNVLINTNYLSNIAYAGGLVGYTGTVTITKCYALGNVTVQFPGTSVVIAGSLAGRIGGGTVTNCFARGNVDAHITNSGSTAAMYAGGLVSQLSGTAHYCYNTGSVAASGYGSVSINGFANTSTSNTACYYNTDTTGRIDTGTGYTYLSTSQMKDSANFSGWDFTGDPPNWSISSSINDGYPYLTGMAP